MLAHFFEASVMFQTGTVLGLYAIIFVVLAVICVATFYSATKTKIE